MAGRLLLLLALAACSGGEAPTPAPVPRPDVEAKRDTGAPATTQEDLEAKARKEYFDKLASGEPVPAPVAPAPAPVAPAPAPAPAPAVVSAPKPAPVAPAPIAPAPAPKPVAAAPKPVVPAPLPKPTTTPNGAVAPVVVAPAVIAAASPTPTPTPSATPRPSVVPVPAPAVIAVEPAPESAPATAMISRADPLQRCGDPAGIAASAARGALSNADLACLDEAFEAAVATEDRERISFIAITNAYAADDAAGQEDSLRRHLTEVDGWNPELAWRYALVLYQKGGSPSEIVHWSEVALEHRTGWTRDVYDQRVYSAYKLRAAASQDLLERAEDNQEAYPSDETDRALIAAREDTKRAAREWYAFARETGQEYQAALDLCLIASQSVAYCDGT